MAAEPGRFTGKHINGLYHINQRLGQGGMGEAYLADFLIHKNSLVVVKFLLDDARGQLSQKALQDFSKEAGTHAKLTHPNIILFYGNGEYQEGNRTFPYIVMEYAEESSVADEVKRRGGLLPEEQSIDFVLQTGDALGYAHSQRVLHCDLKPHNLLLKNELKRYEEALAACEQAIQLNPNFGHVYEHKGSTLIELKRYEEALAALDQALQLDPNLAYAWNGKGLALNGLKRYEEALEAYKKAEELNPSFTLAKTSREQLEEYLNAQKQKRSGFFDWLFG